ncbi:hypothetical protein YC2023_001629 [Brassica napus]
MTPTTNTEEQSPATSVVLTTLTATILRRASRKPQQQHPSFMSSPNLTIKSIFQSEKPQTLFRRDASREEQWRLAVAELSHKLIQATKKKEDAVTEASRLKTSMPELEKKLNKLEIYCHNLKSGLDECSSNNKKQSIPVRFNDGIIQPFLVSPSSRTSNFEASGFQKTSDRCESNYASFNVLMELTWDEVLSRGTKHFSEEFSRFCDRKNECHVASMLCWNRAWPEPLLQVK